MARGWESKAVQDQIESQAREGPARPSLSADERDRAARRASIELSLARVRRELETARPPRRQALEAARRDLEASLRDLSSASRPVP